MRFRPVPAILIALLLAAGVARRDEHRRAGIGIGSIQAAEASPARTGRPGAAGSGGSLTQSGESAEIAGVPVSIWRPSGVSGAAPVIVFSHGWLGSANQSTFLTAGLAAHGYLVIAPDHRDSSGNKRPAGARVDPKSFIHPGEWNDTVFRDRRDDIFAIVKALKSDRKWSGAIDWKRFGLAGHSLGGYTVLGLAGAWPSWKLPEKVKAVLALSPFCTPYLANHTLASLHVPVMYQGGTADFGITPFVGKSGGAYDQTSSPDYFINFQGAGHLAFTDLNPRFQVAILAYSLAFFDRYVKGDAKTDLSFRLPEVRDYRSK
jgi:predicted dienelactone hydrolase